MRIIVIHNYYKGGSGGEDVVFKNEVDLLRSKGHNVETITFSNQNIKGGIISIFNGFSAIFNFRSYRLVSRVIKNFKPDLIHVHNTFFLASPSVYFAARKFRIPVVQTLHNYRLICPSATLLYKNEIYERSIKYIFPLDAILKGVYKNSSVQTTMVILISGIHKILSTYRNLISRFIVLSDFSVEKFKYSSLKLDSKKLVVKPNFIEDMGFSDQKEDYFVFVGRLSEEKGIGTLLGAFEGTEFKLRIIGAGDLKPLVENSVKTNQNITYLGFMDREEIALQIRRAKCLIFPSNWYETFGLTIIEAFSCGTPVLTSNIGGHCAMVEPNKTGFHFKVNDYQDLKEKVREISQMDIGEISLNARREYESKYTGEINYKFLIRIYQDALGHS